MKPFKTIDEQYDLLVTRGLNFTNKAEAKHFLLNNNYYNVINCYAKFFMNSHDKFIEGTTFDEITYLQHYDKEIKAIFFKSILEAEKHFKAILAYRFSEKFRNEKFAYLIASNYSNKEILQVTKTIASLSSIIRKYKNKPNNSISHYLNKHYDIPFWILTNYMNFGQLLYFYKYLDDSLQNNIAKDFSYFLKENLDIKSIQLTSNTLISFLENIIEIRNIVAHNNKLLSFKCKGHVHYLKELHDLYAIPNTSCKQDVYNVFIIFQTFLSKKQYDHLHNSLLNETKCLRSKLKTIDINIILNSLGFPKNWDLTCEISK